MESKFIEGFVKSVYRNRRLRGVGRIFVRKGSDLFPNKGDGHVHVNR